MVRAKRIVHAVSSCTLGVLMGACAPGPGPDDPSKWYGPPGNGVADADQEDTESGSDTDDDSKADSGAGGPADDETSGGPSPGTDSTPTTEGPPDDDSGDTPSNPGSSGNAVLDACLDIAADACEECGCNMCLASLEACEVDAGCVAMRDCAQQSGCTDTTSCYEACTNVIDQHGGILGSSAVLAATLSECMDGSCTGACT